MTHSQTTTRNVRYLLPLLALALATACTRSEDSQLQWARAALERNPEIEIVAADAKAGVFTLRDRATGDVSVVSLQEIAAAPLAQLLRKPLPLAPAPASTPAPPAPEVPAAPVTPADEESPIPPVAPSIVNEPTTTVADAKPYTIDRSSGQLKVSGPGISVVSAEPAAKMTQENQGPRTVEPIICEGHRMLHFDNRNIYVDGDAITVRGGCELYITNSNIVASGTGVMIHDGTVHIANSHIAGSASSFQAGSLAKIFVRGSTFQGLSRRDQLATVQDQGGNQWR